MQNLAVFSIIYMIRIRFFGPRELNQNGFSGARYLMNRCDVGSDGKTPLQRPRGRKDNTPILEFGEKILYMPAKPARGGKWEPRFHPGVFVGMLDLVVRGCHRARASDQDTRSERQGNS